MTKAKTHRNLRELREAVGLSLTAMVESSGWSKPMLSSAENGRLIVSEKMLRDYAAALKAPYAQVAKLYWSGVLNEALTRVERAKAEIAAIPR